MLTIRLTRRGKKNQPFFRVVVVDKRKSAKGRRIVEDLGYVNPLTKKKSLDKDRVLYWIKNGAKLSDTVHNLLVSEKIIEAKKIHVSRLKKPEESKLAETKPVEAKKPTETTQGPEPLPEMPKTEEKVPESPAAASESALPLEPPQNLDKQ